MQSLIVLTLLQLCRAEISEIVPGTWFSANDINDGYSPKPILELFSTEPNIGFSPTKPIVVLPTSQTQTDREPVRISTTKSGKRRSSSTKRPSSSRPTYSTYDSTTPYPPSSIPSSSPLPTSDSVSDGNTMTTAYPPPKNFPIFNFPTSQLSQTQSTTGAYNAVDPNSLTTVTPYYLPQTETSSLPYLVLNENTPENIPTSYTETTSKGPILFPAIATKPSTPPDAITPYITGVYSDGTSRPTVTFRSTPPSTISPPSTILSVGTKYLCDPTIRVTGPSSPMPPHILAGPPGVPFSPKLRIRIVAPKGSITNLKINPVTTTKRPPTTRKPKVKKNTHEGCVANCKGKRESLCAIPLGTLMVEPKVLKGFPSICHMACHNSFKKEPYEKIVDGRCGKIRTRIIRVETNAKIHREELKKSEYSIINNGPQTVVELAGSNLEKSSKQ